LITENGVPDDVAESSNPTADEVMFLHQHLQALHQAIREGSRVKGYYAWSLVDNFESGLAVPSVEAPQHMSGPHLMTVTLRPAGT